LTNYPKYSIISNPLELEKPMENRDWLARQKTILLEKLAIYNGPTDSLIASRGEFAAIVKRGLPVEYILESLSRLNNGEYSTCKDCGENIPRERHETVPGAVRCVDCQKIADQR
jgi:hypothetical protein